MNKRLTMMSVRQMRPLILKLREDLREAKDRLRNFEKRLESYRVTEQGLRDRVAWLEAQERRKAP